MTQVRRRRISTVLLAVLLGVCTTLAIAVGCGMTLALPYGLPRFGPPTMSCAFVMDDRPWSIVEWRRVGVWLELWDEVRREDFTAPKAGVGKAAGGGAAATAVVEDPQVLVRDLMKYLEEMKRSNGRTTELRKDAPEWGQFARGVVPPRRVEKPGAKPSSLIGADIGYGWPRVALWYQVLGTGQGNKSFTDSVNGGVVVKGTPEVRGSVWCSVIPYWPAWGGMAVDSAVFAAVWLVLLVVPGAARRVIRRRRGRCPACGYDLIATPAGSPCPECGSVPDR